MNPVALTPKAPSPEAPRESRVVVITGGSSGLGRCTARHFAQRGWSVGLIARGEAGLAATAADVRSAGSAAAFAVADVTNSGALQEAAGLIESALGPADVWINCAGNGVYGRFATVPEAEFEQVTAVTYGGTVNGCRVALGLMRARGRGTIVNVCSAVAFHGLPLLTSYAGAKAAVRGFAQALRAELRMEGSRIRVATVFPPAVNTPFFSRAVSHMGWPARPAPPVYQPEIVAAGIYLAAIEGPGELVVSGTAALFALVSRLSPSLIAFAMTRIGFDGQLTRDPGAAQLEGPALFGPRLDPSPTHGPFGARARRWSLQLWLSQRLRQGWVGWLPRRERWANLPRVAPSPAKPAPVKPV